MRSTYVRLALTLCAVAMTTAACGGGKEVGGDLKADGNVTGAGAIGQATTTTAAAGVTPTTAAPTATTARATPTTAAVPAVMFTIQDDTKGQYIDPLHNAVRAGALVRFTNQDDTPHTIVGKIGSSVVMGPSPSIAPGASWDVRPAAKGTYDIIDEQRPYAAGVTLTVS